MKHIHLPTLLMHLALLLLARLTINDYHDFFLGIAILVLTAHLIWAFRSKRDFHTAHTLGVILHLLAGYLGWMKISSGSFGLGGGGFAWFFYGIALAVSFAVLSILRVVRMLRKI